MYYPDNVIEDIRIGNDIVNVIGEYVNLKKKGNSYFGLCPFHRESTPSFSVSPDAQLFHCFGCHVGGNVYSFIMQIENFDFMEAVKFLADRINYTLPKEDYSLEARKKAAEKDLIYEINKKTARHFYENLNSKEGIQARNYLDERKIGLKTRARFGLGYSFYKRNDIYNFLKNEGYDTEIILKSGLVIKNGNDFKDRFFNRVMFPIIDAGGRIVGFGGRVIGKGEPKYLNSSDSPVFLKSKNLFGINLARQSRMKEFILVEGYMDVISLHQCGFRNTVAALGTAFNNEHAKVLKKYANSVIILFDSDEAGTNAALRAIPVLDENGINTKVLQVEGAKDPDEYIKKFGKDAFLKQLEGAKSHILFLIQKEKEKYNLNKVEQKVLFTKKIAEILSKLDNEIERDAYLTEVSVLTSIGKSAILNEIKKLSDNNFIDINKTKYNKPKYEINKNGINEARLGMLRIMADDYSIFLKINSILKAFEFEVPVYVKLAEIIEKTYKEERSVYPAEIISYFEDIEEQKVISQVFLNDKKIKTENTFEKEKLINDWIRKIKLEYVEEEIKKELEKDNNSGIRLSELVNIKKNINSLNITLTDG